MDAQDRLEAELRRGDDVAEPGRLDPLEHELDALGTLVRRHEFPAV
jgi:hypothetical protein